nr:unnamed protein product [Callosobruchus analis]
MVSVKVFVGVFVCIMVMASVMEPVQAENCNSVRQSFDNQEVCSMHCTRICSVNHCRRKGCSNGTCECISMVFNDLLSSKCEFAKLHFIRNKMQPMLSVKVFVGVLVCIIVMASIMEPLKAADCNSVRQPFSNQEICTMHCTWICAVNRCRRKDCNNEFQLPQQAMASVKIFVGVFACIMVMGSVMKPIEAANCNSVRQSFGNQEICTMHCTTICAVNHCRRKGCNNGTCECM